MRIDWTIAFTGHHFMGRVAEMHHIRQYAFLYGLCAVLLLAVFASNLTNREVLSPFLLGETLKWWIIAVIFFFQGLGLPKGALSRAFKPVRMPAFVLFWNFIGTALVIFVGILPWIEPSELQIGFFFLAFVPTTIALSVSYTDLSGGRVPVALFATCLSNLVGMVILPLMFLGLYLSSDVSFQSILKLVQTLFSFLILPVGLAYKLRQILPALSERLLPFKKSLVEGLLLILIFNAFLRCFCEGREASHPLSGGDEPFLLSMALSSFAFFAITAAVWKSSQWLKLDTASRIAVFFTASQKSICTGIPLILLTVSASGQNYNPGLLLLPLITYYTLQTIFGALLSYRFRQKG